MIRQTKVAITLLFHARSRVLLSSILIFTCLSNAVSMAQADAGSPTPTAGTTCGQSVEPSMPAAPGCLKIQPPEQPKAPIEAVAKNRQSATQPAPKKVELTDFQQFVAQSLGYVLPI